jgi:alanyl-tRNA synthetase
MRTYRDAVAGCIRSVSVAPSDLPAAVERLQAEAKEMQKAIRGLQERLAVLGAATLAESAERLEGGSRLLARMVEPDDPNVLKAMALAICAEAGFRVALFSQSAPHLVVVARSKDETTNAGTVVRALTAAFGGKGGGKPDLAQGGGLSGGSEALLSAAREHLLQ